MHMFNRVVRYFACTEYVFLEGGGEYIVDTSCLDENVSLGLGV